MIPSKRRSKLYNHFLNEMRLCRRKKHPCWRDIFSVRKAQSDDRASHGLPWAPGALQDSRDWGWGGGQDQMLHPVRVRRAGTYNWVLKHGDWRGVGKH